MGRVKCLYHEPLAREPAQDHPRVEAIAKLLLEIKHLLGVRDRAHHQRDVVLGDAVAHAKEGCLAEERIGVKRERRPAVTQPHRDLLRCHDLVPPGGSTIAQS